jgi:hypothetical protein
VYEEGTPTGTTPQGSSDRALFQGLSFHDPELMLASLDHAMGFHRPLRFDEWMLYSQRSPSMTHSRDFTSDQPYTRNGHLALRLEHPANASNAPSKSGQSPRMAAVATQLGLA